MESEEQASYPPEVESRTPRMQLRENAQRCNLPEDALRPACIPEPILLEPTRSISVVPLTVQGYFERWVADKVPPEVRRAQANDYCRHMKGYVLPVLRDMPLEALMARDILGLRTEPVLLKA